MDESLESQIEARALAKAQSDGVTITKLSDGSYATRSSKTPAGVTYTTTKTICTCPATVTICKHIAAVRAEEQRQAEYLERVRESRRQSQAVRTLMHAAEKNGGSWHTVTGSGRIGKRASFHRGPLGEGMGES